MASLSWPDGLTDYKFSPNRSPTGRAAITAEYFAKTGNGNYYCIACKDGDPSREFIIEEGKTGSIARLRRHLKSTHPAIHKQIYDDQGWGCNFYVPAEEFTGITEKRTLEMTLNLVYHSDLFFDFVKDRSTIELFSFRAHPDFTLPSVKSMKEAALKKYNEVKTCIKKLLAPVRKVSITLDRCDTETEVPFVGIRVHWVDDSWILCERFLYVADMYFMDDDEDDPILAELLIETLQDFNLMDKVCAITTNYAKDDIKMLVSFPKALEIIEASFNKQYHMPCLAHVVNQIAQEELEQLGIPLPPLMPEFDDEFGDSDSPARPCKVPQETIDNTLGKFVGRLRDAILATLASPKSKALYKKLCKDLGMLNKKGLRLEATKEWTSTYEMLVAAWKKRQVLDEMAVKAMKWQSEEWESLKFIIRALSPLYYCVELLRKSNSISASTTIRTLETLLGQMDSYIKEMDKLSSGASNLAWSEEQLSLLKDTYRVMKEKLATLDNSLKSSPIFAIAAALDPQMKLSGSLSIQRDLVYENIVRLLEEVVEGETTSGHDAPAQQTETEGVNVIEPMTKKLKMSLEEELDEYFQEACVVDQEPLSWWRQTGRWRFPRLAVLAKDFLALCPVSTSFPRMFEAGLKTVPYYKIVHNSSRLLMTLKSWAWEEDPNSDVEEDSDSDMEEDPENDVEVSEDEDSERNMEGDPASDTDEDELSDDDDD